MPSSHPGAIPEIMYALQTLRPRAVLDVGAGFGKYGVLIREYLEVTQNRLTKEEWQLVLHGVEVFPNYKNPIHEYCYDRMFFADINEIAESLPMAYDVILMVDVIEHMTKEDGRALLRRLLKKTKKALVLSTPYSPYPQGPLYGNEHEAHLSSWGVPDFIDFNFSFKVLPIEPHYKKLLVCIYPIPWPVSFKKGQETTEVRLSDDEGPSNRMTIASFVPHSNLTGGLKAFLYTLRYLQERGHRIVTFGAPLPDWSPLIPDESFNGIDDLAQLRQRLSTCDVIFAVWWQHLPMLSRLGLPVIYWEQGHEWLYGDFGTLLVPPTIISQLVISYGQRFYPIAVSSFAARALKARFGIESAVVPVGIDTASYRPYPKEEREIPLVLLMGNPYLPFKGFDTAILALNLLWEKGYRFRVKWICQLKPHNIRSLAFPLELAINPPQTELPRHIAEADIFVSTSWYESFGLPPLEAMSCGVAVVATDSGGIREYARHGINALLVPPDDYIALANSVATLIKDRSLRERLGERGRETAIKFDFRNTIPLLEHHLAKAKRSREL